MPGPAGLTPREVEVLILISRGAQTSVVADRLGISRKTAATHIERIYTKTGVVVPLDRDVVRVAQRPA